MNKLQAAVAEFHTVTENPVGTKPADIAPARKRLRLGLMAEELSELAEAMGDQRSPFGNLAETDSCPDFIEATLIGVADGIADLLYVVLGTAVEYGIDIDPIFAIVHEANMRKVGGPVREDGKSLKPIGWVGPEALISFEILKQMDES